MTTTQSPLESTELWAAMATAYDSGNRAWTETTERQFENQLNVLPPLHYAVNGFIAGGQWASVEATGRGLYAAFKRVGGRYFATYCQVSEFDHLPSPLQSPAMANGLPWPVAQARYQYVVLASEEY